MARIPVLTPETAEEPVAGVLRQLPPLNVLGTVAHASAAFEPWVRYTSALLNESQLDSVLREIAILRVAALSPGADYEWDQHEVIARDVGVTEAQIEGCRTGEGLEGDAELVALLTEELVRDVSPSDETFARGSARFGSRQLMELILIVGQYMLVARVAATAQLEDDPPVGIGLLDKMRLG